ncbi:copper amine oxidase N-terminal domain-containing protein [Paenibacillus alginolyticus]|uniref:Copper amine oxidase N-terminal domain-containing protein n=1 Tax=Paenibacillus alginolyticus TaxID=59839 RepID=A0ABT4G7M5_9BACL|nr:copper amine oxidase N-terminal domain-containing protein [Paenibacillus alginolyticus]MCY9692139.1 copper amine oxidase N-terminal domain-containing protein [Paenibacillus alginolyticus]MEC0147904.1 copper amine oxidase N-terminal domain-containing protein [Paenibacillus alginolyticus]
MQRKKLTWWISTALVIMLLALTGCQAVQGLDLGQAIQNSASIQSAESKGSLQMDIITGNTDGLPADEKRLIDVLHHVNVELKSVKMQDKQHISVDGALNLYSKGSIPFQLNINGTKFTIHIEGAKKPLFFDLMAAKPGLAGSSSPSLSSEMQQQLLKKAEELWPALLKFFLSNAPNPEHFSVSSVSEPVNSETLSMQKAHIELKGNELVGLLKTFLTNILADEKGMKELIGQLYDVLVPVIKEQMKASPSKSGVSSELPDLMMAYLDNKTLAVEFVYTTIQQFLRKALDDWDKNMQKTLSSVSDSQAKALLSDKTALKTDVFIDTDKQIRKVNAELTLPITEINAGISALKFTYTSEIWNINKPVTASVIDTSGGVLDLSKISTNNDTFLKYFNKDSTFYSFLKDDLKIAKKDIHLLMSQGSDDDYKFDSSHPFINEDQVSMVPVRFLSERLGTQVKWHADSKQITVKDELNDKTIILTLNSKTASVNGSPIQLDSAPILKHGSTFVPLRFIAEQLGCKVIFDNKTGSVNITR